MTTTRAAGAITLAIAFAIVAVPFFAATTFIGDDHIFLAFARHQPNPLSAFVADKHGGEFYRPWPMLVWWVLGRLGGGSPLPFALAALALHAGAALLVAVLLRELGRPPSVALGSAALLFLAPQNLEAAWWFSASTDLWATVFALTSLTLLLRGRHALASLAALGAFLSKESAYVLPALAVVALWSRAEVVGAGASARHRRELGALAPQVALLAGVILVRRAVLHGWGGSGDPRAGVFGLALQIVGGLAQLFTGDQIVPAPMAFAVGFTVIALSLLSAARRGQGAAAFAPFAFAAVASLPLSAAGWAVGARYFYMPSIGICWAAAEALAATSAAAQITVATALIVAGTAAATQRRGDVLSYERRVAAAERALGSGLRAGHHVFHVDGGIKDIDLAVKESPMLEAAGVLVLGDVPASFAIVPTSLGAAAASLVAVPPLPPSGGYSFGDVRVVGLARRGDEPGWGEVLARFPDLRFIRLLPAGAGLVVARDLTEEMKQRVDAAGSGGQD